MNDLLKVATLELERFLAASLPPLADDWRPKHVLNRLQTILKIVGKISANAAFSL